MQTVSSKQWPVLVLRYKNFIFKQYFKFQNSFFINSKSFINDKRSDRETGIFNGCLKPLPHLLLLFSWLKEGFHFFFVLKMKTNLIA